MPTSRALDVFCHILPAEYSRTVHRLVRRGLFMFERAESIPVMVDLSARFRVMDQFPGYAQIPSLASPPPEMLADGKEAAEIARCGNDSLAALAREHPHRFPAFVAALPLNNPDAALNETRRAITELGAAGVQIFTSVNGHPLDEPQYLQIFDLVAELGAAVWLHPIRPMTTPDYPVEEVSKFDLWWALGWPHESSVAMGRLVFSGLFDRHPNLTVITHHVGGTVPMMAGRLGSGLDLLGTRVPPGQEEAIRTPLKERPLNAFRRFHADTASFGSQEAILCGRAFFGVQKLLFATDMPFDPEQGPGYIRETLAALRQMDLSPIELQAVLYQNAARILKLNF